MSATPAPPKRQDKSHGEAFCVVWDPSGEHPQDVYSGSRQECRKAWRNLFDSNLMYEVMPASKYNPKRVVAPPARPFPPPEEWISPPDEAVGKHDRVIPVKPPSVKREKK